MADLVLYNPAGEYVLHEGNNMNVLVKSSNGRVHLAERQTNLNPSSKENRSKLAKEKKPQKQEGYVRKLCDGQWVSEKKIVAGEVTCPVCSKL